MMKSTTINHDKTQLDVQYIFEGVERRVQILTVNKLPIYFFDEHLIEDFYFAIGETLINESIERAEYREEMKSDESRGN